MIGNFIKRLFCTMVFLGTTQAFAEDETIRIIVKSSDKTVAGIGYAVEGKQMGAIGKLYKGKGFKNREYAFGYRRHSIVSSNIPCGSKILTKDCTVTLVTKGDKCLFIVNE